MELAYTYHARGNHDRSVRGVVYAPNRALGFARLKRAGFAPTRLAFSPLHTVQGWLRKEFSRSELARFYNTVGRRMQNGKPMVEGLEAASEYVADPRLRQAVMVMKQAILDGRSEFEAMSLSGFPRRDAMMVRATAEAGRTASSFQALSREISRVESLRKSVSTIFRMPKMMAVLMVGFVWTALTFIAPMTLSFLKQTNLRLNFNAFLSAYFDFVRLYEQAPWLNSALYFAAFAVGVALLRRPFVRRQLDRIPILLAISTKADQASLWNSFLLLYDAAIPAKEAARVVAEAASRPDSRAAFLRLGKMVEAGRSLDEAVAGANFPTFVVNGVRSAVSSGDVVAGLSDMAANLEEDVMVLTDILKENVKLFATLGVAVGVLLVFTLTYYPMLASVLSNL
jgi:type II secretory pathway component PulF